MRNAIQKSTTEVASEQGASLIIRKVWNKNGLFDCIPCGGSQFRYQSLLTSPCRFEVRRGRTPRSTSSNTGSRNNFILIKKHIFAKPDFSSHSIAVVLPPVEDFHSLTPRSSLFTPCLFRIEWIKLWSFWLFISQQTYHYGSLKHFAWHSLQTLIRKYVKGPCRK